MFTTQSYALGRTLRVLQDAQHDAGARARLAGVARAQRGALETIYQLVDKHLGLRSTSSAASPVDSRKPSGPPAPVDRASRGPSARTVRRREARARARTTRKDAAPPVAPNTAADDADDFLASQPAHPSEDPRRQGQPPTTDAPMREAEGAHATPAPLVPAFGELRETPTTMAEPLATPMLPPGSGGTGPVAATPQTSLPSSVEGTPSKRRRVRASPDMPPSINHKGIRRGFLDCPTSTAARPPGGRRTEDSNLPGSTDAAAGRPTRARHALAAAAGSRGHA